jgi:hypothetical protein
MEKSIDELDLFHFGQSEVYSQRIFFKSIESSVNSNTEGRIKKKFHYHNF